MLLENLHRAEQAGFRQWRIGRQLADVCLRPALLRRQARVADDAIVNVNGS
jgi:hypothetical protein